MHLLTCPSCQASIPVASSQAGDETNCPNCQAVVAIPKLGQLRQLPTQQTEATEDPTIEPGGPPASPGRRAAFVMLCLVATLSLLAAGFCGIRWSLIDAPITTEIHIETLREEYSGLNAAQLIREYEDMDKYGLDLASPYNYKRVETKKRKWGRNASIAGLIGAIALLGAIAISVTDGRKQA